MPTDGHWSLSIKHAVNTVQEWLIESLFQRLQELFKKTIHLDIKVLILIMADGEQGIITTTNQYC